MKKIFSIILFLLIALPVWSAEVTTGDKVITGNLYIGGSIINDALTAEIAASLPTNDVLTYKGVMSSLATFPAANKGDVYKITAAGAIGGTGATVAIGDIIICNTDSTSAGNYAAVGTKWDIIPTTNIDSLDDLLAGTAENDFIVAGAAPFTWAKKSLTDVKSTLGLGTAAYTASTAYDPAGTAAGKIASSISDSDTTHCPDGNSVYDALVGKETAGAAAAVIVSSISDSDTTHAPDGNSVFDALALKLDKASAAPVILAITEKTPVNAVAASKLLTVGTAPAEGATVSVGGVEYTFRAILGAGVKASAALTFTGNAVDNETITIGSGANERVYTFANAVSALGAKATGELTFNANPAENEVVLIGSTTYRFRDQIAAIASFETLTFTAVAANTETVTVDTTEYTFVTALTETKATGVLTASANPTDGNRVVIGSTEYTYRDTVSEAYDVHIGISAEASLLNLVEAITNGANEGTDYGTDTDAHPTVTAAEGAGDTVDVTAKAVGVAGNIASVGYGGVLSFAAATLEGGLDPVLNEILVEAGTEAEIDNLVAAAMTGVGAGTKFSTGQPQLVNVTLTKTDATNMLATANVAGTAGDSIAIAETCAQVVWTGGATNLSGGYDTAAAYDVIIDAGDPTVTVTNLIAAITDGGGVGTGEGTLYGVGTAAHPSVTADHTLDVLDITALAYGDAGNAIVTTTDAGGDAVWGAGTLEGGEDPEAAYIVLIGVDAQASIDNLADAINAENGAGELGTLYGTGTLVHPSVSAAKTAADVLTATALSIGGAGNLIAISKTVTLATWAGAGFLTSGYDAQTANDVLIGTVEESIDYLVLAITAGAGVGTSYGTGTVINPLATAVKASSSTMTATNKIKGVIGNSTAIAETLADGSWAAADVFLTGGINGTVGVANETCADATYFYHAVAANTIADANWRRIELGAAY